MPLSLDGFCAHHEGQSHRTDWYCKQYFYIRLIHLNWTIHLQEGKTGSGWKKATLQTMGDNYNQKHYIFLILLIRDFLFNDNQRIRQVKLWLYLWILKSHYRPEVSVGWGGNIFISSAGLDEGSWDSSERWDEVMRGHVEQLSVTANQREPLRMESRETKGNKEMKHKHKPLWANSITSELTVHWWHMASLHRHK